MKGTILIFIPLFLIALVAINLWDWKVNSANFIEEEDVHVSNLVPRNVDSIKEINDDDPEKFDSHIPLESRRENILSEPGLIPVDRDLQTNAGRQRYAYRYIFNQLERYKSNMIFYPYGFGFEEENEEGEMEEFNFYWGSMINADGIADTWYYTHQMEGDLEFGQAKTLYDFNIAVLKIRKDYNGQSTELLYEADTFCTATVTFLGHYGSSCIDADAYRNLEDKSGVRFVYVTEEDLDLLEEDEGQFGILVIPDIILGSEDFIYSQIGSTGASQIRSFVQSGGFVYASGKGAILLEKMSLITSGSYDSSHILVSETNYADVEGCKPRPSPDSADFSDYVKAALCFGVTNHTENTYMLSTYMMKKSQTLSSLKPVNYFSPDGLGKKDTVNGFNVALTESEKAFLPMLLHRNYGKGQIVVNNGFAVHNTDYFHWWFNSLFLAMGRNYYLNTEVSLGNGQKDLPIPGNEDGVMLNINQKFMNLFSNDITNLEMEFWFPTKVELKSMTVEGGVNGACEFVENLTPPETVQSLNASGYRCSWTKISPMSSSTIESKIEIMDASVTRRRYNIQMLYTRLTYTNSRISKTYEFEPGSFLINAQVAALLRPSVNPDPSSFYPIPGEGVYVDNVIPCQNSEHTSAYEVEYVAILPVVTPAVDGDDQGAMIKLVEFYEDYYKESTNGIMDYVYPFSDTYDYDYIDYNFLSGKGALLNADWDTGVMQTKETLDLTKTNLPVTTSMANYSSTNTNSYVVTKQLHYSDSKNFFEHATQRQLVFLDTTTERGAESYYGTTIPTSDKKPGKAVAKTKFIWVRADIYFYYSDDQYTHPDGLEVTDVISIDRYSGDSYSGNCDANGDASILVSGHFDSTQSPGLVPNEYSNELLNNCAGPMYEDKFRRKVKYTDVEEESDGGIIPIHYLVPVADEDITRASDIYNFVETTNGEGYLNGYEEVQYIFAHEIVFTLAPDISRLGGKWKVTLPSGMAFEGGADPVEQEWITYTADHIAVYKTEWNAAERSITTFFKRGSRSNERYGEDSGIGINLEHLDTSLANFTVSVAFYNLKYDLSDASGDYEKYEYVHTENLLAVKNDFFSLPAIKMVMKLNRTSNGVSDNTIHGWELLEPMSRYGFYFQELEKHRTVWGIAESHHVTDPGLTAENSGFSVISQVGISSIPFLEYVTAGSGQLIPSSSETSRVEWKDIWGRTYSQPIRSVFPDVPPIPPPLRNFMMSTTFEVTDQTDGSRVLEWDAQTTMDITLKIKLLNNYPKHFDITNCKANEVYALREDWDPPSRIFTDAPYDEQVKSLPDYDYEVDMGWQSFYGNCFAQSGVKLSGESLSGNDFTTIATHCNKDDQPSACETELKKLPTLSARPSTEKTKTGKLWNYSPQIQSFYPSNYIKDNMWDLTHYDYDDNVFDISYKYHMDNRLPSFDNPIVKPHNIISQPLWKGFGFSIEYDQTHSAYRYPEYRGWWSDNLQNKDDTLLAGQDYAYDISVDRTTSSIADDEWIELWQMKNRTTRTEKALTNIYVCEFNRHRIKMSPNHDRKYTPMNVYQNNVVPVKHGLSWTDKYNYNCDLSVGQYDQYNISQFDNLVETSSARDYLYFSAGLRGGAKETINVVYQLKRYDEETFHEGDTKINEGGRFVYWNPANGPNSFLIVDNPVNVIKAVRSDIYMNTELFPQSSDPFDVEIYHLISIYDTEEIERKFKDTFYINHYGFGDSLIWTYVGGVDGTKAIVAPGEYTIVRITINNNAGFDWNLKSDAIRSKEIDQTAISAYELLKGIQHSVRIPTEYKFLTVTPPDEIKDYVTIKPSEHTAYIAPLFFDFQSINTALIRDGFKADYFLNVTFAKDFPDELRGKLYEFEVTLNEQYFDKLPGYNDPTTSGFHDYKLQVPSFKIGIPYSSANPTSKYAGNIYYANGFSHDLVHKHYIDPTFDIEGVKYIESSQISTLRTKASNTETSYVQLQEFFEDELTESVDYTYNQQTGLLEIKLSEDNGFEDFPKVLDDPYMPPQAAVYLLAKSTAPQVSFGTNTLITDETVFEYTDHSGNDRESLMEEPNYRTINVKGPWLNIEYFVTLVENTGTEENPVYEEKDNQYLYPHDSGILKVLVKTTNIGDGISYDVKYTLNFEKNVGVISSAIDDKYVVQDRGNGKTNVTIYTKHDISPGVPDSRIYYMHFEPLPELVNRTDYYNFPEERNFVEDMDMTMSLSSSSSGKEVTQHLDESFSMKYILRAKDIVELDGKIDENNKRIKLHATANQPKINERNILYLFTVANRNCTDEDYNEGLCEKNLVLCEAQESPDCEFNYEGENNYVKDSYDVTTLDPESLNHLASGSWKDGNYTWMLVVAAMIATPLGLCCCALCCLLALLACLFIGCCTVSRLGKKKKHKYVDDSPFLGQYNKMDEKELQEDGFDLNGLLNDFGKENKTAFIFEGRPVSVNWNNLNIKDSETAKKFSS